MAAEYFLTASGLPRGCLRIASRLPSDGLSNAGAFYPQLASPPLDHRSLFRSQLRAP